MDPVYQWLAVQPEPIRFAEVPFGLSVNTEQRYQYASTWHWQPMLNGSMGVTPIVHAYMRSRLAEPPTLSTLGELRALDLEHVVLHPRAQPKGPRGRWEAYADAHPTALAHRHATARSVVYEIGNVPERPWVAGEGLPRDAWAISASDATSLARFAIDDDEHTAWRSWGDLERRLRHWYAPTSFHQAWLTFLERQPSYLTVDLGGPTALRAAVLRLGHSDPDAVDLLRFSVSDDGTEWRALDTRVRVVGSVRRLVTHGSETPLAFVFPRDTTARHVRVAGHGIDWEVADLELHQRLHQTASPAR
jgi:hypothetical protein